MWDEHSQSIGLKNEPWKFSALKRRVKTQQIKCNYTRHIQIYFNGQIGANVLTAIAAYLVRNPIRPVGAPLWNAHKEGLSKTTE